MNDDVKLVAAFLALNAGVIALAFAGYLKGNMNIGAVLQHLGSIVPLTLRIGQAQAPFPAAELKYG